MKDVLTFGKRRPCARADQEWNVWIKGKCMCVHHEKVREAIALAHGQDADARSLEAARLGIPQCNWEGFLYNYDEHVRNCSSERKLLNRRKLDPTRQNGVIKGSGSLVSPDARCDQMIKAVPGFDGVDYPMKDWQPEGDEGYRILRIVEPIPGIEWARPRGPFRMLEWSKNHAKTRILVVYDDIGGCSYGIRDADGREGWFPLCCTQPVEHVPREFPRWFKPVGVAHEVAEFAYAPREPPAQVQASEDVRTVSVIRAFTLKSDVRSNKRAEYLMTVPAFPAHTPSLHSSVFTLAFPAQCFESKASSGPAHELADARCQMCTASLDCHAVSARQCLSRI